MSEKEEQIIGYFPVIHDGYVELVEQYPDADIGVLDTDVLSGRFDYLRKDIRALQPETAVRLLSGLDRTVRLIGEKSLRKVMGSHKLIMPDDDVSRALASEFAADPTYAPVFLRWHRENVNSVVPVEPDRTVELSSDDPVISALRMEANKSTNWWRRVAAAIVEESEVVAIAHNTSMPTSYSSALAGDPRITAKRGADIEISIDIHAESRLISHMAKNGISTDGKSITVSTFPCPNCAKLIAESGFKSCYFIEGYAMLDGQSILQSAEVEIVKIETEDEMTDPRTFKPYPAS